MSNIFKKDKKLGFLTFLNRAIVQRFLKRL